MVTDLLDAADKVTVEQAIAIAFCTQVWHAERWQARIEKAWKHAAEEDKAGDAGRLYEHDRHWNRRSDPDSHGAMAFYAFKKALGGEAAKQTEPPASLTDAQILEAMRKGAAALKTHFGEVEVPFGRYFRVGRRGGDRTWPVGGGSLQDQGMATPRAISFAPSQDGKEQIGHTGQSSTQIVIMTDPPESYAVIPLGESDHKESGHLDDQAEKLFSKGKAAPNLLPPPGRTDEACHVEEDIEAHSRYEPLNEKWVHGFRLPPLRRACGGVKPGSKSARGRSQDPSRAPPFAGGIISTVSVTARVDSS